MGSESKPKVDRRNDGLPFLRPINLEDVASRLGCATLTLGELMEQQRAAFLFGSGTSYESGGPKVKKITESLLFDHWNSETDGSFRRNEDGHPSCRVAGAVQEFMWLLKSHLDPHLLLREKRVSHYEDLYAAALQIKQDETAEIVNPLLAGSQSLLRSQSTSLQENFRSADEDEPGDFTPFAHLAEKATDLIQWVVYDALVRLKNPTGLDVLSDLAKAGVGLDIFTLNHDTLFETQFNKTDVSFNDGFNNQSKHPKIAVYDSNWHKTNSANVRLLKLHGSIDYHLFRLTDKQFIFDQYAKKLDFDLVFSPEVDQLTSTPVFLTGKMVKEQQYGFGLFGDLILKFDEFLSQHRTLVCCGYGWGDRGINLKVEQWLRNSPNNRLVVLDERDAAMLEHESPWQLGWQALVSSGKIRVVKKWLSACTLGDLKNAIS